jgi:glycosyltransferase involved in cell wall biosynthesis
MLNQTLRSANRVISVSSDLMRRSVTLGCPEGNAVFLTNGVDPAKFALRTKTECRERLGLPINRKIGVYVGYLIDRKNQSMVIRAMDEIRKRGHLPPLLVLVGDGSNRKQLQKETSDLGLNENVLFAGQRPHEEVALWMGAADWLLLSSSYEGWATVYFEAMACGRPVLTSNVSSAKDAICKPDYGCVIDPTSPEAFATAIIEASSKEFDAQLLRAYAEEHSWARWAEQAMYVFEKVIEEKGRR